MKKQMFVILAALVLSSVGHAKLETGDINHDPQRPVIGVENAAADKKSAESAEADCPYRTKGAPAQVAEVAAPVAPVKGNQVVE